jgi:hypothetical protein
VVTAELGTLPYPLRIDVVFITLKEMTASIMAAYYSRLAYNDTLPLCLLLFPTG